MWGDVIEERYSVLWLHTPSHPPYLKEGGGCYLLCHKLCEEISIGLLGELECISCSWEMTQRTRTYTCVRI